MNSAVLSAGLSIYAVVTDHVAAILGSLDLLSIVDQDSRIMLVDIGGGSCSGVLVHLTGGVSV